MFLADHGMCAILGILCITLFETGKRSGPCNFGWACLRRSTRTGSAGLQRCYVAQWLLMTVCCFYYLYRRWNLVEHMIMIVFSIFVSSLILWIFCYFCLLFSRYSFFSYCKRGKVEVFALVRSFNVHVNVCHVIPLKLYIPWCIIFDL